MLVDDPAVCDREPGCDAARQRVTRGMAFCRKLAVVQLFAGFPSRYVTSLVSPPRRRTQPMTTRIETSA
jgi:hypothetical protein